MTEQPNSLEVFTGDRAAAEHLRRSLQALAEEYDGTPLAGQIGDVLAGRRDFRALAEDPEFASLALEGTRRYQEYWASLTPDERADLAQQGEATLAAIDDERGL